jgi:hypothetical protein
MDDIPGFVWVIIGIFISVVSLFMGFLRPVTYNAFFKLMLVVGIGMLIYGYIFKIRLGQKSKEDMIEDRRQQLMQQRGEYEADIDIDDFKNNPALRQEAMKKGYPSSQPSQQFRQMEQQYQQKIQDKKQQGNQQQRNPMQQQQPQQPMQRMQQRPQQPQQTSFQNYQASQMPQRAGGQRFCPSCGTPLLKEHKFCPICGARV